MNKNLLKAEIIRNGLTQAKVAAAVGMSETTFNRKLKRGVFGTDEAEQIISFLGIKNPCEVFFANEVTLKVSKTNKEARDETAHHI